MKLPAFLEGIPRSVLILGAPLVVFLITVGLTLGVGGGDDEPQEQPQAVVSTSVPLPTAAPAATAVATPVNRADCNAIRGSDYKSDAERDWFRANCSGSTTAQSSGGTSSTGAARSSAPTTSASSGAQVPTGQRLVISKAGINTDIYITKMTSSQMANPVGYFNALTYDMSDYGLGGDVNNGNMVLSGHVDCGRCYNGGAGIAVFWHARELRPGDGAQVYTADGRVVNYVVTSSAAYSANQDFTPWVASSAADMTIITCTGNFSGGEYDNRHVVQFRKV
jgi:hypothetical protein